MLDREENKLEIPVLARLDSARVYLPGKISFQPFKKADKEEITSLLPTKPDELADMISESGFVSEIEEQVSDLKVDEIGDDWQSFKDSGFLTGDTYNFGEASFDEGLFELFSDNGIDV